MAAVVPSQFLFTADPSAGVILGFKINRDGGLSPVPGSPFVTGGAPRLLSNLDGTLLVAGSSSLMAFTVNRETGAITKTDSLRLGVVSALISDPSSHTAFASTQSGPTGVRMVNHHLQGTSIPEAVAVNGNTGTAVLDASGKFMYLLDNRKGIISAFAVENGNPVELSPKSYPAGHASTSLAIVEP